jgi:glycosyltransferase involved in cell wall biosynthesis
MPALHDKLTEKKQLWMVSEYYHPCDNATGQIMTVIAGMLAKNFPINIITTTQQGTSFSSDTAGLKIFRISDSSLNKDSLIQRPLRIFILSVRLFFNILRLVKKNDTIISVTNPTLLTFLLQFGKMIRGFKLLLIMHDLFPENMVATGIIKRSNPFYLITRWGFRKALDSFDAVVVIGRDMEQLMKQKIRNQLKIHYLPNFAETDKIVPSEKRKNPIIIQYHLEDKLVILFAGNIGRAQNVDFICELLTTLKQTSEVYFLIIGDGAMKEILAKCIRDNGLTNTKLLPAMSRKKENIFLNAGDIGLVSLKPGLKGMGVPSKTYSYMAAAKPVLALVEPGSEIDLLIREHPIGWSLDPVNLEHCVSTILALKNSSGEIKEKGELARKTCENYYTPEIYIENLIQIINLL